MKLLQALKEMKMTDNIMVDENSYKEIKFKKLGDVCEFQRGMTITQKEAIEGEVPVIAGGQRPSYYHNSYNRRGETIAVSGSGAYAGFVSYWTIPVFLSDSFSVNCDNNILITKYVYYFLKHYQKAIHDTKKGSGVPHVHGSSIAHFIIPIPPLPTQHEIVSILDKFTALEAELEAELETRKKQYEYYRNELLSFEGKEVEWKMMGEIGEFVRGKRFVKTDIVSDGVPCIHYGEMYTHYKIWATESISFLKSALAG